MNIRHASKTAEHYTPPGVVEALRRVLGGSFDCDPASCEPAQKIVQATNWLQADPTCPVCNPEQALNGNVHHEGCAIDPFIIWPVGRTLVNPPGDKRGQLVKDFWRRAVRHAREGNPVAWIGFNIGQLRTLQKTPYHPLQYPTVIPSKRIAYVSTRVQIQGALPGSHKIEINHREHDLTFNLDGMDLWVRLDNQEPVPLSRDHKAEFDYHEVVTSVQSKGPITVKHQTSPSHDSYVTILTKEKSIVERLAIEADDSESPLQGFFHFGRPKQPGIRLHVPRQWAP